MNEGTCYNGYITTREAKKVLGVKESTLRRWVDQGLFPSIKTPAGHRLYNVQQYLQSRHFGGGGENETIAKTEERQKICYCRFSSQGQKNDLQRQISYMQEKFPDHKIITDIGSGINFRRKGLRTILELSSKGAVSQVVVAYRDRLCRFAFELLEWIFHLHEVKLVVLNQEMDSSGNNELAEDLLAIINVFNCRVNGKRKYKKGTEKQIDKKQETESQHISESGSETYS
jgi:excisionase family DNA binding protein